MSQQPGQPPRAPHPTLINLPPPPSRPDTPSEVPGTPTSTTTSLSALSTTAIKDGHRGALHHQGHQHSPSANSLEAERADRISRLTGLSNVSTLRGPPPGFGQQNANLQQTTPTASGLAANPQGVNLTPAYFDAAGQPVAVTKVSTVGSASATDSVDERTSTITEVGGDQFALPDDRDEDMFTEMDSASASGYMGVDAMDEDLDNLASRSVGGEDRLSDDGSASLVGFGEGAGSTLSGPIYHRRPGPIQGSGTAPGAGVFIWPPERTSSGLSEVATASPNPHHTGGSSSRRDFAARSSDRDTGSDTPVSQTAVRERREARMMDGVAMDHPTPVATAAAEAPMTGRGATGDEDVFVDTTTRGPVPAHPPTATTTSTATTRGRQHPYSRHQQHQAARTNQQHQQHPTPSTTRDAVERIIRERLDDGEGRVRGTALGSPKGDERLGRFYFER